MGAIEDGAHEQPHDTQKSMVQARLAARARRISMLRRRVVAAASTVTTTSDDSATASSATAAPTLVSTSQS